MQRAAKHRAATREAYDSHFPEMMKIYATGQQGSSSVSVNMSMIVALRAFVTAAREDGISHTPDPSHTSGFQEGPTPRRMLEVGASLGSEAVLFAMICRKPVDVVAMDVSEPCIAFAKKAAAPQAPPGARLSFVAADVAEVGRSEHIDALLGVGRPVESSALPARHLRPTIGGARVAEPPPVAFQKPFDLIYSTGTLHHLPPVDLLAALRGLRARAHPRHGVMVASFHAFTAASCMPRQGGTGYARVRGLTPHKVRGLLGRAGGIGGDDEASIRSALSALVRRFDHPIMNQLFDPASELPDEYRSKILLDLLDAQSTDDDGGGLGACVVTGVEHLGIPGRYERHYSKAPLQRLFEAAGWHVRECRDNTAAETGPGTEGTLIYVIAQVAAPAAAGDSCTDAEP